MLDASFSGNFLQITSKLWNLSRNNMKDINTFLVHYVTGIVGCPEYFTELKYL